MSKSISPPEQVGLYSYCVWWTINGLILTGMKVSSVFSQPFTSNGKQSYFMILPRPTLNPLLGFTEESTLISESPAETSSSGLLKLPIFCYQFQSVCVCVRPDMRGALDKILFPSTMKDIRCNSNQWTTGVVMCFLRGVWLHWRTVVGVMARNM